MTEYSIQWSEVDASCLLLGLYAKTQSTTADGSVVVRCQDKSSPNSRKHACTAHYIGIHVTVMPYSNHGFSKGIFRTAPPAYFTNAERLGY